MSEHFLKKTKVEKDQLVSVHDVPVVEQFESLKAAIAARAGAEAARIFAEPFVNWGNDVSGSTVSWYGDVPGNAQRLSGLDPDRRAEAEERLTRALGQVRALLGDPEIGKLVAGALSIPSPEDILVVGSRPLITNWGMRPAGAVAGESADNEHFAATLGKYLPLGAAPVLFATDVLDAPPASGAAAASQAAGMQPASAASAAQPSDVRPQAVVGGDGSGGSVPPQDRGDGGADDDAPRGSGRALIWPVAVLAVVLAIVAAWLLLPGTRLFPTDGRAAERALDDSSLDLVRQLNADLAERERVLQAALDGAVCMPDGSLVLPDGRLPDGLLPPPRDASISPTETGRGEVIREGRSDAVAPPDPTRIAVPEAPRPNGSLAEEKLGEDDSAQQQNLVEVVEERTVLVIARNGEGLGVGTGFFIAPDLVATNHHVIEAALKGGSVLVSNGALAELHPAEVVTSDGPFADTLADFALLRVPGVSSPYFSVAAGDRTLKLQNVIAAGYPTDIMETDYRFRQLLEGASDAVPDLIFTDGVVNTEQGVSETRSLLVHSAPISKGNSGGPLVDTCGRVVGMNTFVREESFRNLNIAQSNRNFMEFLGGAGVSPATVTNPCVPQVMRVSVPREMPDEEGEPPSAAPAPETPPSAAAPDGAVPAPANRDGASAPERPAPSTAVQEDDARAPETPAEAPSDSAAAPVVPDAAEPDAGGPAETAETPAAEDAEGTGGAGSDEAAPEVSVAEAAPEPERIVPPDLGPPLAPGLLDTRSIPPEALE